MDICINNSNNVNFNGWQESINSANPISKAITKYLYHSAEYSRKKLNSIIPELSGKFKVVFLKNNGKTSASGWDINPSESEKYVLFLHGMAQNITSDQRLYQTVLKKDYGVFALEYRGYGINNATKIDEDALLKDVDAAYKYLTETRNINPKNITIIGHSMGGALGTTFASKHPEINSLVLISPITSIYWLGEKFATNKTLGLNISKKIFKIFTNSNLFNWLLSFRLNSMSKANKLDIPTYVIHSRNDAVTPYKYTRLFTNKLRKHGVLKGFTTLSQGGHNIDYRKIQAIDNILDIINK